MKITILANNAASFVRPMADGLAKMLKEIGESPTIHYGGLDFLHSLAILENHSTWSKFSYRLGKDVVKILINKVFPQRHRIDILIDRSEMIDDLRTSDVIVVVAHLPAAFTASLGIEKLRELTDAPIVLYDLVNLGVAGKWVEHILNSGGFGLERYDWHLSASVVSETRMPREFNAWSRIGLDVRAPNLYPQQSDFVALLDFPRSGYENERKVQLEACVETGTKFIQLDRPMTQDQIRNVYRRASMFFLSFRERFGLPIVELQQCGSYIVAPNKEWVPSHYLKDLHEPGMGELTENFIIYDGDKNWLKEHICRVKASFDPASVVDRLKQRQPHLYEGDRSELALFIDRVRTKEITSQSHESYAMYNRTVPTGVRSMTIG